MSVSSRGSATDILDATDFNIQLMRLARQQASRSDAVKELEKSFANDYQSFEPQDKLLKTLVSQSWRNTFVNQDPCTIPDDLREELMRQKRKDDAFKTALCDSFRRNKTCSYGDQCRFAHGVQELRLPQNPRGRNHPKYKTVLCDKFSTSGNCKYGTRCQFIHKVVNPAYLAQTGGMLNTSSASTAFNQSLFLPSLHADMSMDMNQSMPIRQADINRAFARAGKVDSNIESANDGIMHLARAVNSEFNRTFSFQNFQKP